MGDPGGMGDPEGWEIQLIGQLGMECTAVNREGWEAVTGIPAHSPHPASCQASASASRNCMFLVMEHEASEFETMTETKTPPDSATRDQYD